MAKFAVIKKGKKGDMVKAIQYIVGAEPDGDFGSKTKKAVIAYQTQYDLEADGEVGINTITVMINNAPTLRVGSTGVYVQAVEVLLNTLTADGIYREDEIQHVKTYQAARNLEVDGVVGKQTYKALFNVTQTNSTVVPSQDSDLNTEPVEETPAGEKPAVVNVKPTNFKQFDKKWKEIPYTIINSASQTIGSSGCGPTSGADIVNTWFDKNFTPVESCALAKANGYRTKNSGTKGSYFKFLATQYKVAKYVQTSSWATMQACLADGGYVAVNVKKSKWTNGGHYMVIWKDDGKNVYICDPGSSKSERAQGTYAEMKAAAHQFYCFWPN